jgi:hypothetical protein
MYSQNNSQEIIYEAYDKIVGLDNTGIYNGTEFNDIYLNTDGTHRYFNAFNFTKGNVFYDGQFYSNVLLKYDILEENLITISDDNLSIFQTKLIPAFIESFSIYNRKFVKLQNTGLNLEENIFFEIAYTGEKFNLYEKHHKKIQINVLKSAVQYKFKNDDFYVLKHNETYYRINSIKDLEKSLPDFEVEIKKYYRNYRKLYKSNPDVFLTNLITSLDNSKTQNR